MGRYNFISGLDGNTTFAARLHELQKSAAALLPDGERLRFACAVYNPERDLLHTFADSGEGAGSFAHYSFHLADAPSLDFVHKVGGERVIADLSVFADSGRPHTAKLLELGFHSSFARAVHYADQLIGIVFVNAPAVDYFTAARLALIDPFVRLASLHLALELSYYQSFSAAITAAQAISAYRDTDTAEHLMRMSHVSAVIADAISEKYGLDDEFVAKLFQFAPLHDIGKVGVPDAILLKPGKLTAAEFEEMKLHVEMGLAMVDKIIDALRLGDLDGIDILRNTVRYHHERLDGTGYPYGLKGGEMPIESQIMAVADIFDALTSHRPYKEAWPIETAIAELRRLAPAKLNADCVEALADNLPKLREIIAVFGDKPVVTA